MLLFFWHGHVDGAAVGVAGDCAATSKLPQGHEAEGGGHRKSPYSMVRSDETPGWARHPFRAAWARAVRQPCRRRADAVSERVLSASWESATETCLLYWICQGHESCHKRGRSGKLSLVPGFRGRRRGDGQGCARSGFARSARLVDFGLSPQSHREHRASPHGMGSAIGEGEMHETNSPPCRSSSLRPILLFGFPFLLGFDGSMPRGDALCSP